MATITGGSGIATGGITGSTVITYTLPTGCTASSVLNVLALPAPVTGAAAVCAGSTTGLTGTGGGTWTSSNVAVAAVGPTGIVSGVAAGSATITYTLSSGCSTTKNILVNPIPAPITGVLSFCDGAGTSLTSATPGGIWASSNTALAIVVPSSGAVTSVAAGFPTISYTLSTGCVTTTVVTINALPSAFAVTGGGGYCVGTGGVHIGLGLSTTGVSYKLYNGPTLLTTTGGSNSALDFGIFATNGTYTAVGINATTGCTNAMAGSVTVIANPLPNAFNVTGGGNFCPGAAGVHVYQGGSDAGVSYQLNVGGAPQGAAVSGTGGTIDFGAQTTPGVYTVTAISTVTGCSRTMSGTATVALNALPPVHTLSSGGSYCIGGTGINVTLDGSDASTAYQLFLGGTAVGLPLPGAGAPVNFGLRTAVGNYTVVATNVTTGCTANMAGTATITTNPLPLVYNVTGGGSFCPGGSGAHVNLNYSASGVNYQLYRSSSPVSGALIPGSNSGLDFGLQTTPGVYTVVAIDASTGCGANMLGSAVVSISALPVNHNVTGGGAYCAGGTGRHVGLNGSNADTRYQLLFGGVPSGIPVTGTGAAIDFGVKNTIGSYSVVATTIATSCVAVMPGTADISVNPLPSVDSVIAAGTSYCAGGTGIDILLNMSDAGVSYQLYRGGAVTGSAMAGTGAAIDFGMKTLAGNYTVVATDGTTGCQATMFGTASISINPLPAVYVVNGGGHFCDGGNGVHVYQSGSTIGINYQLSNTLGVVGVPFTGLGSTIDFGLMTIAGPYTVVATDPATGCSTNMAGAPSVTIDSLPSRYTVGGSANYCAGGAGVPVNLSGSTAGIHYQLYKNGTPVTGGMSTGLGTAVSFGLRTEGVYTVKATNVATGCTLFMTDSATVGTNPLPVPQTVTGGGAYCAGSTGADVALDGSLLGVTYTLLRAGSPVATPPVAGTGAPLDFGMFTAAGAYTVIAADDVTGCSRNMTSAATITITPQPGTFSVTGGGAYCAGGTGTAIGLAGSNAGIIYQLMSGGFAVGSAVTGTGGTVNFGLHSAAGSYTVIASPGGLCETGMTGAATVTITPLPVLHNVTGGGSYCSNDSGATVTLDGSNPGISYQLYHGLTSVGSAVGGTGSALSLGRQTISGLYTIKATDIVTGCQSTMTGSAAVSSVPAPVVYRVVGGGAYCAGGNGVNVLLNGSNTNVNYQLRKVTGELIGTPMAGTGTILDFGLQTAATGYVVSGTDAGNACAANMADTAHITINPIVTPVVTLASHPNGPIKMGQRDTIIATVTNGGVDGATFVWKVNRFPITAATTNMFISDKFADKDTVTCEVTSSGDCGGITVTKSVVMSVLNTVYVQPLVAGAANVKVTPNPSKGIFTIAGSIGTNDDQKVSIEVLDILGHVIYSETTIAHNGNLDNHIELGSSVANGMYLLNIRSAAASQVFHIVVEN